MYLSRLYIKNYRSISELDLQFTKGKNVLVGRNKVDPFVKTQFGQK